MNTDVPEAGSAERAVDIKPATTFACESTRLVHAFRASATHAQASDELDDRGVRSRVLVAFDRQAEPGRPGRLRIEIEGCRARAFVPGSQQVILQPKHVSAVAGTHQALSRWRRFASVPEATARRQGLAGTARARRVRRGR